MKIGFPLGGGGAGQPVHWCRVTRSAAQSIPNATLTSLNFNVERWDTSGMHSNTVNNSRITIPAGAGGLWLIGGNVRWSPGAANTTRSMSCPINGNLSNRPFRMDLHAAYVAEVMHCATTLWVMSAGDYIELRVYQNSGGPLNIDKQDTYSPEFFVAGPFPTY